MLFSQVLCYLISITKPCFIAVTAARNWAKVKSLSGTVNSVLMAGVVRVVFKAFCIVNLDVKEAQ
jgi:hypothetical protein